MDNHPLQTTVCALLGSRYPILQAGMGGPARSELAAAVSQAGGFGCLGMVRETPDFITRQIADVRRRTDRNFGVNLIPAATDPQLFDEEVAACLAAKVHALVYFWDVVPEAIARAKAAGCRVFYQVGSVAAARQAEAAGADAVIAQGVEAGGHVHGAVTSLVLLPQVVRAVRIPVIASGGFASGAGLVAALALGAQAIHCGTAFLVADESFAHDMHKDAVIAATEVDTVHTDAFAINWPPHSPVRVLNRTETQALGDRLWGHDAAQMPRQIVADEEGRPIYLYSTDSPLRSMTGDLGRLAFFAGQVAGQVSARRPAADIITAMVEEALAILTQLRQMEEHSKPQGEATP